MCFGRDRSFETVGKIASRELLGRTAVNEIKAGNAQNSTGLCPESNPDRGELQHSQNAPFLSFFLYWTVLSVDYAIDKLNLQY